MTRREKIIEVITNLNYTYKNLEYRPIGRANEMCGPSGGWSVELYKNGEYVDIAVGYNYQELIEYIERISDGHI